MNMTFQVWGVGTFSLGVLPKAHEFQAGLMICMVVVAVDGDGDRDGGRGGGSGEESGRNNANLEVG
jgi:hypothetical protein